MRLITWNAFDASKYGEISAAPVLDVTIPTILDPSLAPEGKHVLSAYFQFAPYKLKKGTWKERRGELANSVIKTLSAYAPNLPRLVESAHVITPLDLETDYGFTGGHIFHGELALDQLFTMRPVLDWARYQTPVKGLFLCSNGTHPGNGLTGASGANAAKEIIHELR
jgi:phytoene dehydrogenase-like protein